MLRKIAINMSWLTLGHAITRIFKFLLIVLAVHMLRIDGYGTFAYVLAYVSLFFIAVSLLHTLSPLQRDMIASPDRVTQLLGKHAVWRLWIVLLTTFAAIACSFFFPDMPTLMVVVIAASLAIDFMRDLLGVTLQAGEHMKQEGFSLIAQSLGAVASASVFLVVAPSGFALAGSYLTGSLLGFIVTFCYFSQRHSTKETYRALRSPEYDFVKEYVPLSFGVGIAWMFSMTLLIQFGTFIFGVYFDAATVGIVSILLTLVQIAVVPFTMLGSSLLPTIVRNASDSVEVTVVGVATLLLGFVTVAVLPFVSAIVGFFLPSVPWDTVAYLILAMSILGCMFALYFYIFVAHKDWKQVVIASSSIALVGAAGLFFAVSHGSLQLFFILFTCIYLAFSVMFICLMYRKNKESKTDKARLVEYGALLLCTVAAITASAVTGSSIIPAIILLIICVFGYGRIKHSVTMLTNNTI